MRSVNNIVLLVDLCPSRKESIYGQPALSTTESPKTRLLYDSVHEAFSSDVEIIPTSLFHSYVPESVEGTLVNFKKGVKSSDYIRAVDRLSNMIDNLLARPNVNLYVIAIGSLPAAAMLGDSFNEVTMKYRGSIYERHNEAGIPYVCMPIIDPNIAWMKYEFVHLIRMDIAKMGRLYLKRLASPETPVTEPYKLIIEPSYVDVKAYIDMAMTSSIVSFDIETSKSFAITTVSVSAGADSAISIPFSYKSGRAYFAPEYEVKVLKLLNQLLSSGKPILIHNAQFDIMHMMKNYRIPVMHPIDTMILQGLWSTEISKSLASFTSLWTDLPYYKDEGHAVIKGNKKTIPDDSLQEGFWRYSALDALALTRGVPRLIKSLRSKGQLDAAMTQNKLTWQLALATLRGIRYDTGVVKQFEETSKAEMDKHLEEFDQWVRQYTKDPVLISSPKQLGDFLRNKVRLPLPMTKAGQVATDERTLVKAAHDTPQVKTILKWRQASKIVTTYCGAKPSEDGRMRSSYNPVGTLSGRLSSSKLLDGTGMNLQNVPSKFRKALLIDKGYVGFEIDLGQAENRMVAFYARDPNMMKAFNEGIDIHSLTASMIFGGAPTKEAQSALATELGGGQHPRRFYGKKANHGLNYGLMYKSFAEYLDSSLSDAKFLYDAYHKAYPSVRAYHRSVENELYKTGRVTNMFGRSYIPMGRISESLMTAYSFVPQSSIASLISLRGVIPLDTNRLFSKLEFLNQVHDSIWVQVRVSDGWEYISDCLAEIRRSLEQPLSFYEGETFVIPADVSMALGNFGSKEEVPDLLPNTLKEYYEKYRELHKSVPKVY